VSLVGVFSFGIVFPRIMGLVRINGVSPLATRARGKSGIIFYYYFNIVLNDNIQ